MTINVQEEAVRDKRGLLEECNSYIKEYLERNQLLRTTKEFERECSELRLPLPRIINGSVLQIIQQLHVVVFLLTYNYHGRIIAI